ncbi:MAG: TetR family transcriptional regulator [Clostridium sp.]|nr:TetR family transcriptional regulator [Clostridium sp.]
MPTNTFFNLPEEKKNKILKAANKEFARVPLEQVSIKNIVEDAEIARGSFYQYFEDKEDLFDYMMDLKIGDIENKLNRLIEKENGNIINICVSLYDHLIQVGKLRKNNKFFRKIFENIKTSDNLMFIKKENRNIKLEQKLYDLYDKNKEILNVRNKEEFRLVVEMLFAITRRRIVASLKYKDLYEARNDYLKEIEFIKNGILK